MPPFFTQKYSNISLRKRQYSRLLTSGRASARDDVVLFGECEVFLDGQSRLRSNVAEQPEQAPIDHEGDHEIGHQHAEDYLTELKKRKKT